MKLKDHSLRQMDDAYLRSLSELQLRNLSSKLLWDLKEARDRLNQNPSNSSRPPSSQAPWLGPDDAQQDSEEASEELVSEEGTWDREEEAKETQEGGVSSESENAQSPKPKIRRKPGKPKGAQGYGRTQKLEVTDTIHHTAGCCDGCGQEAPGGLEAQTGWTGYYTIDIEVGKGSTGGIVVTNTKHLYYELVCVCGHRTREDPYRAPADSSWEAVALTHWRLVGPMLCALVMALTYRSRMSRVRVREFLLEWLGISLSVGTLQRCLEEAARAATPVEDQLINEVVASELLYADETPHPQGRLRLWLWVFVCSTTVLYFIGSRSKEIVEKLLGKKFEGWLMSDGYVCYRHILRRLRCWAHLLRKAQGLKDSFDERAQGFGGTTLDLLEALIKAVYLARKGRGEYIEPVWREKLAAFRRECERMKLSTHEKTRQLAVEFLNDWNVIFMVLHHPHLPLTNNEAERMLRHWVILRRIAFGTRSKVGSKAFALLASVIDTCRRRNASPWRYLAEVVAAARQGLPVPSLPPNT